MGTSGHVYRTKSLEYKTMKLMFCEAAVSLGVGCAFQSWLKNLRVSWTTIQDHPGSCRIVGSVEAG